MTEERKLTPDEEAALGGLNKRTMFYRFDQIAESRRMLRHALKEMIEIAKNCDPVLLPSAVIKCAEHARMADLRRFPFADGIRGDMPHADQSAYMK